MAISHALSGDLISTLPLRAALRDTCSHAVVKGRDLEVIRLVLLAGDTMPLHDVPGEVTLLCLEGRIELTLSQATRTMVSGDFVYLAAQAPHALRALEDASALLTISLISP